MRKNAAAFVLLLFATACSSSNATDPTDVSPDKSPEVVIASDGVAADIPADYGPGKETVAVPPCEPGEGCFGELCTGNDDCQSGWCVDHMGEGFCTQACQEECPQGWTCQQVMGTGPDVSWICVSIFTNLCRPCVDNNDCKSAVGVEDVCVDYGNEGAFCGGACEKDADCPWGFSCDEVETVSGATLKQCATDAGTCPCTMKSISLALHTQCEVANEFGTCVGQRVCTENGLTDCDASVPAEEVCDGLDNDCDGEVDEPFLVEGDYVNICNDDNPCTDDKCLGEEGCAYPVLEGECMDGDPCTVADHCEGGVCIGEPVICEDENPCTDDVCTDTGGCDFIPNSGDCDDWDPCSVGDECQDGLCQGTPLSCDCLADIDCAMLEDLNLCNGTLVCDVSELPYKCVVDPDTVIVCPPAEGENAFCLQPSCEPATGECSLEPDHEGFLCDDADACSVADKCTDGVCTGGQAVNCNDGNECTDDSCDPDLGCINEPNSEPCFDGDPCTLDDFCDAGACQPGLDLFDCDDGNPCTDDFCSANLGCLHTPIDDKTPCGTPGFVCIDGECKMGCVPGLSSGKTKAGSFGIVWVEIPAGCFLMGCSPGDVQCTEEEVGITGYHHEVMVQTFEMLETEVTEAQYAAVMTGMTVQGSLVDPDPSSDASDGGGDDSPVEFISWYHAKAFCEEIGGRLPTEAEWEYAARGGTATKYYCGNWESCLGNIAWYAVNSDDGPGKHKHDVKGKDANYYNLYDMLGNVLEWVKDCSHGDYDIAPSVAYPDWNTNCGPGRVVRGGGFHTSGQYLRASARYFSGPEDLHHALGFRCAR